MAVIENQIKLDDKAVSKIIKFLKEIFNQPKGLMIAVVIVIMGVAGYFWYTTSSERTSILDLLELVEEINLVVNKNLNVTDYEENLLNIITGIKLLKQEDQQSYEDELLELSLLITFIEKYHPNDPIVVDLKSMQSRLEANHDIYKEHFDYVMKLLDAVVSDTIK